MLESDESASEVICVAPSELSENVLGCFTVNWKRFMFVENLINLINSKHNYIVIIVDS